MLNICAETIGTLLKLFRAAMTKLWWLICKKNDNSFKYYETERLLKHKPDASAKSQTDISSVMIIQSHMIQVSTAPLSKR